ncbi:hypothetical protein HU200_066437 [Digitaria exilis]|uniref:Uncharacterized protein n=1 Tax=Digitaria exilis TaxID=1010633 RepID=A0A834ZY87_9POAL|nr:hypothetical protein HU200_066437 [Digitaria exilis]CAB3457995.1 unnamed protein product [Digitaria exilis]
MARDSIHGASWEETFRWQRPPLPEEPPPEVRDVSIDPFSLRQFSRLDIDRPLPIPSVSVDDHRAHASPALLDDDAGAPGTEVSSTLASVAGELKPSATPSPLTEAQPRSKLSAAGWEAELADAGLDVDLISPERKANEPQRWGSDVPLIATEYSFGRGKQAAKHAAGRAPPFTCCMYVPGLTRRVKPPLSSSSTATAAARSFSSSTFGKATAPATTMLQADDPARSCSARRSSTVSVAVSLERFDCGNLSSASASSRGLGLDLDDEGEAASSSSYFDLPLELILGCDDDGDEPVCAAFLFDSDGVRKSVLKRRLQAGVGMEPRRPSLGKVSTDSSGRTSTHHVRVSLKSRSPAASTSP